MGSNRNTTGEVSERTGFRFHPTEEELVNHYLKKKKQDQNFKVDDIIPEIDVCKYEPWELPALLCSKPDSDPYHDMEWFVFSSRDYKYINNSTRFNRTTREGFWKITGKDRLIWAESSKAVIGRKRILTFYEGRVPNHKRTNWVMHEYYLVESTETIPDPKLDQRDFVLCRLKKKPDEKDTSAYAEGEPSSYNVSNCDDQAAAAVVTPEVSSSSSLPLPTVSQVLSIKLNGDNYPLWLAQIIPVLKSRHLMSFIDGSSKCPAAFLSDDKGSITSTVNPQYETWVQKEQLVMSMINGSLTKPILLAVARSISARDTWVALERCFGKLEIDHIGSAHGEDSFLGQ